MEGIICVGLYGPNTTKADVKRVKQFLCDTDFLSITKLKLLVSRQVSRKKKTRNNLISIFPVS